MGRSEFAAGSRFPALPRNSQETQENLLMTMVRLRMRTASVD
jgi:hypothetical protein